MWIGPEKVVLCGSIEAGTSGPADSVANWQHTFQFFLKVETGSERSAEWCLWMAEYLDLHAIAGAVGLESCRSTGCHRRNDLMHLPWPRPRGQWHPGCLEDLAQERQRNTSASRNLADLAHSML